MTLRKRILTGLGVALIGVVVTIGVLLSYEAPCRAPEALPAGTVQMLAVVQRCYGSADVLKVEHVARPDLKEDRVLVKVMASSVNPLDWHYMTGTPYVPRLSAGLGAPEHARPGVDFAGTVEAVGSKVTRFKPGDEVFGVHSGAFAEYVSVAQSGAIVLKPATVSFAEAAALPVAAITALQGLRDHGKLRAGSKVLINGASGGVGTYAVQIAKSFGAEVTGVCSTRNVELVRSIGADHVIDYTKEDFTRGGERYDLILDNVGNHALLDIRRALKPGAKLVMVGGPKKDPWLGPLTQPIKAALLSPFIEETMETFMAEVTQKDLQILANMATSKQIVAVIDRHYALSAVPEALRYVGTQRARGKVVIDTQDAEDTQRVSAR